MKNQDLLFVRLLEPAKTKIYRDKEGYLRVKIGSFEEHKVTRVIRAFPITMPWRCIILMNENGREIGLISDVKRLDPESFKVLREELERTYFIPKITKVHDIREEYGILIFRVETDKGPRSFEVTSRRDIRKIGGNRIFIKDADGNFYDIPNYKSLDKQSVDLLEMII